jgi:hypothetical protein
MSRRGHAFEILFCLICFTAWIAKERLDDFIDTVLFICVGIVALGAIYWYRRRRGLDP